uniref:Ig-like domain-containing protein n=1 Tax=Anas platyrhynchos platyrhynchos TaxID=8840 RepID=A0A493TS28_ANAPP
MAHVFCFSFPLFLSKKCLQLTSASKPKPCSWTFPPHAKPQAKRLLLGMLLWLLQTPVSITMSQGTARLQCHFKDVSANFDNTVIHWYQQKENREPVRMLYISSGTTTVENNFQRNRYMVQNLSNQKICILIIKNIGPDDAATYYCTLCTVSGYYYKVFGTGTKLIVSDKGNSKPENSEILQTKHKDQLLYVCLIENFYPEVIRVQWVDEANKEVTKNVIKGDVWKSTNDKYSVSTWLTLPGNTTNKNYYCKYDHETINITFQPSKCILTKICTKIILTEVCT